MTQNTLIVTAPRDTPPETSQPNLNLNTEAVYDHQASNVKRKFGRRQSDGLAILNPSFLRGEDAAST